MNADKKGTEIVFDAVAETVCSVRASKPLTPDWSREINDDYNSRK